MCSVSSEPGRQQALAHTLGRIRGDRVRGCLMRSWVGQHYRLHAVRVVQSMGDLRRRSSCTRCARERERQQPMVHTLLPGARKAFPAGGAPLVVPALSDGTRGGSLLAELHLQRAAG